MTVFKFYIFIPDLKIHVYIREPLHIKYVMV